MHGTGLCLAHEGSSAGRSCGVYGKPTSGPRRNMQSAIGVDVKEKTSGRGRKVDKVADALRDRTEAVDHASVETHLNSKTCKSTLLTIMALILFPCHLIMCLVCALPHLCPVPAASADPALSSHISCL